MTPTDTAYLLGAYVGGVIASSFWVAIALCESKNVRQVPRVALNLATVFIVLSWPLVTPFFLWGAFRNVSKGKV